MLNSYLEASPPSKFILIQDCLQERGDRIVNMLSKHHQKFQRSVNCFIFEGHYERKNAKLSSESITCYDFTRYMPKNSAESLEHVEKKMASRLTKNSVIILDSLVHLIYLYGLVRAYKLLNSLMRTMKDGQQIIAVLHTDLFENIDKISQCMEHLATLSVTLDPAVSRLHYTYKKIGGRVFKQIEEYRFEKDQLITDALKKPDINKLVQDKINEIDPEYLTTFKIGLSDDEKESRDNLVLPYLPKDESENSEGQIFYKFDEGDDWDEEDPDDDLDI